MAKIYEDGLSAELAAWVEQQPMFFVATAPSSGGHVNVSPKGYDTLRVLGPRRLVYRDLTGSGAETPAHLRENGRITVMWCSFGRTARILRFQGAGRVVTPEDDAYDELDGLLPRLPGARAFVEVIADRVATSCGYGVPHMPTVHERDVLLRWAEQKGDDELVSYRERKNRISIDGLPAL